jgi:hypothetical protein
MSLSCGHNYSTLIEFTLSPYSGPSRSFLKFSPFQKKKGVGEMVNHEINLKINKYIRQHDILPSIPKEILLAGIRKKRLIAERKESNPTKGEKRE